MALNHVVVGSFPTDGGKFYWADRSHTQSSHLFAWARQLLSLKPIRGLKTMVGNTE